MALASTNSRAILPRLYYELRQSPVEGWIGNVSGTPVMSNMETETHGGLASTPPLRVWDGGRAVADLGEETFAIRNQRYQTALRVYHKERLYNQTGQIERRIGDLRGRYFQHWDHLVSTLINNGTTGTCYDGTAFFGDDHRDGSQDNSGTAAITLLTEPSIDEVETAIFNGIVAINGFTDDQGEPLNAGLSSFIVMVPASPFIVKSTASAINATLVTSGRSNTVQAAGYNIDLVVNPRITGATLYVFANDGRAFIRQEVEGPVITAKAEGSEYEHDTGHHEYGVHCVRNAGYGHWQSAYRWVWTTA